MEQEHSQARQYANHPTHGEQENAAIPEPVIIRKPKLSSTASKPGRFQARGRQDRRQARISRTTVPCTSVSRRSNPLW